MPLLSASLESNWSAKRINGTVLTVELVALGQERFGWSDTVAWSAGTIQMDF